MIWEFSAAVESDDDEMAEALDAERERMMDVVIIRSQVVLGLSCELSIEAESGMWSEIDLRKDVKRYLCSWRECQGDRMMKLEISRSDLNK